MNNNNVPLVLVLLLLLFLLLLCATVPTEGAAEPTPTAPRPTCSDGGRSWRGCFTPVPTPNEHWIDPIPWPTYSYPTPEAYPAPLPTSTPEAYPEVYSASDSDPVKEKKHFVAESGPTTLAESIWAWILDLFTHDLEGDK